MIHYKNISFPDVILSAALHGQICVYKRGYSPWQHAPQQTHVVISVISVIKRTDYIQNVSNVYVTSHYNTL